MQPASSPHARFWRWFQANGHRLRAMMYGRDHDAREEASEELREAVAHLKPGLVLEFGPTPTEELRDLIVSADGRRERVDFIKDFVASAPELPGWNVVAFRPRMPINEDIAIRLEDQEVGPDDLWFRIAEDDDGLALTLHVRGLTPENERLRGLGAALLAEHSVGERDAMTLLSDLQVEPLPDVPEAAGLRPFRELVSLFDEVKERKYPPPGSLVLDPEGEWQAMEGTMGGSPALVLLNTGLRRVAGHPAYDHRLAVHVPFNRARPDGMPETEDEYTAVQEIGTRLGEGLEEGQQSLLAATIMTKGRRDLILHTHDVDGALRRLESLKAGVQTHRVEASAERDTFWGLYRSLLHGGQKEEAEE